MSAPPDSATVELRDDTSVGEARRLARAVARALAFDDVAAENVAIVATEAARNAATHGGGGALVVTGDPGGAFVDVLALDRGPGIADLTRAMRDGFSTAGTAGQGLGSMARLAATFDVYSAPGLGTVVLARVARRPLAGAAVADVGAVCLPVRSESHAGDAWAVEMPGGRPVLLVADGLGHGPRAAEAAHAAVSAFRRHASLPADRLVERLHGELRPTRGAAIAVAELTGSADLLRFAGIGNISGVVVGSGGMRRLVSLAGTAGHEARTIRGFDYEWPAASSLLIMHSDGIATHWDLAAYPGLAARHPALVAGVLYRDFARGRDDACVVVARRAA
jgi:anti-sigma regulatory factor (Ser/Thr protein kinase)